MPSIPNNQKYILELIDNCLSENKFNENTHYDNIIISIKQTYGNYGIYLAYHFASKCDTDITFEKLVKYYHSVDTKTPIYAPTKNIIFDHAYKDNKEKFFEIKKKYESLMKK